MSNSAQAKAVKNYRKRLSRRGRARFEVLGLASDRLLIRSLAKRLAENDIEARRIRDTVSCVLEAGEGKRGGIYAALRASPLVGADLEIERERDEGRKAAL